MSAILGIGGIAFAIYYVIMFPSTKFHGYMDIPALILIGICPPCVMLLSHTLTDFHTGVSTLLSATFGTRRRIESEIINVLTQASAMVRAEGIGSLLRVRDRIRYDLLRDGVSLIVNDFTADEIRHNLSAKINAKQSRLALASNLFENMSKVCPGMGMVGTLIGLIAMLSNLTDPSKIGGGMAMSMICTLYGLSLGTFIYGPWGEKISLEAEKSLEIDMMVLEGVISLKGKKSSIHLHDIMKTYSKGKPAAGGQR